MGRKRIYTKEELKERQKIYDEKYKNSNLEKRKESLRKAQEKWRRKHGILERKRNSNNLPYYKTPRGRAVCLLNRYKSSDKEHNRGESDLTPEWIVENIFTKPCAHCGIEGWNVIGCNRIDNSKPHTKDNVEPCCGKCNRKLR